MKLSNCLLLVLVGGAAAAQDHPPVSNAHFETRAYTGSLKGMIDSDQPTWFGYAFASIAHDSGSCCWNNGRACSCNLEAEGRASRGEKRNGDTNAGPVKLEGSSSEAVLFRVARHQVERVNIYSMNCELDAGGLPFVWIEKVPADSSLTFLSTLVSTSGPDKVFDSSLLAIAQHDDGRADQLLRQFASTPTPDRIREKAMFWLGAARRSKGVPILKDILAHDSSDHMREKAVFALYVSDQPEGTDALLATAKSDTSPHVREQSLFWLAQRAGKRASTAIIDAIDNDPDTHVKEQAVFALSQLPADESVPKLIEVAKNQRNKKVQERAFFWLGQSRDPRALAYIEQVLTR